MLVLLFAGPFLLLSKKARAGISQKLGFLPQELKVISGQAEKRAWFHAVSVGEFNALYPLLVEFHKQHPEFRLFVSTTTRTGQELACNKVSSIATVFYFPLDLPWATNNFLKAIKPNLVAIVETEIWPGFMNQCRNTGIPVLLVNGRLSPRSYRSYSRWRWFFKPVVNQFSAVAVQSDSEAARFRHLAGDSLNIAVCGNLKFDGLKVIPQAEAKALRQTLALTDSCLTLVAGSTHEKEEAALLQAAAKTKLRLILVPRHPERFERVAKIIEEHGLRPRKHSKNEAFESEKDVYLLDTIGQLNRYYSIADIAFVGGTIAPVGGHNLVEPCIYKVPVLCGSHVHKTKDVAASLLADNALLMVHNQNELEKKIAELIDSKKSRQEIGEAGYLWLEKSQGALKRTLAVLESVLNKNEPGLEQVRSGKSTNATRSG